MPDGNALCLFNDFGYDIYKMSSNICMFLVTTAQRAPGVSCTRESVCVCVCVFVGVKKREGEKIVWENRSSDRDRESVPHHCVCYVHFLGSVVRGVPLLNTIDHRFSILVFLVVEWYSVSLDI